MEQWKGMYRVTSSGVVIERSDLRLRELQEDGHASEPKVTRGPEGHEKCGRYLRSPSDVGSTSPPRRYP